VEKMHGEEVGKRAKTKPDTTDNGISVQGDQKRVKLPEMFIINHGHPKNAIGSENGDTFHTARRDPEQKNTHRTTGTRVRNFFVGV
jgi:hypothetical protein